MEGDEQPQQEEKKFSLLEETERLKNELEALKNDTQPMIKELQELKARDILGGNSSAGTEPDKPKEDTPKEYMEKVMKGELNE